jgi:hypothetical protein
MTAALLAMNHFNDRDPFVVPELANLTDCSIYFDMDNSRFLDSGTRIHLAVQSLVQQETQPCAIAGALNDLPNMDLAAHATAHEYPHVLPRAYNLRLASEKFSPMTSQMSPSLDQLASMTVNYLISWGRTNYTAIIYPTTDLGIQQKEILSIEFLKRDMQFQAAGYFTLNSVFAAETEEDDETSDRETESVLYGGNGNLTNNSDRGFGLMQTSMPEDILRHALQQVKDSG